MGSSVTTWTRLEPWNRDATMERGLQARVHDPLWMLGRQWQVGEFKGQDAGSPVRVTFERSFIFPSELAGDTARPLEAWVEGEPIRKLTDTASPPDCALDALEAGQTLLTCLQDRKISQSNQALFNKAFAWPPAQQQSEPLKRLFPDGNKALRYYVQAWNLTLGTLSQYLQGKMGLPNTWALWEDAYENGDEIPIDPKLDPLGKITDKAQCKSATLAVLEFVLGCLQFDSAALEGDSGRWDSQRMEYAFSLNAKPVQDNQYKLSAPEYRGDRLDWYSFALSGSNNRKNPIDTTPLTVLRPFPASFPGMPAARWWEFEDASVDFHQPRFGREKDQAVGTSGYQPTDLIHMQLIEFAVTYGNDWFVVPLEMPVGALCQLTDFKVVDTFGRTILVPPAFKKDVEMKDVDTMVPVRSTGGVPHWQMFQLSGQEKVSNGSGVLQAPLFYLAPALGAHAQSEPVEDVRFIRDESANMVWAIEHSVEGSDARPMVLETPRSEANSTAQANPSAPLVYQVATRVPEHWIPYLPATDGQLQMGAMPPPIGDMKVTPPAPIGVLLWENKDKSEGKLFDEEVTPEGVCVTRVYQLARGSDGSIHLWKGRMKGPGQPIPGSGLKFDVVTPKNS